MADEANGDILLLLSEETEKTSDDALRFRRMRDCPCGYSSLAGTFFSSEPPCPISDVRGGGFPDMGYGVDGCNMSEAGPCAQKCIDDAPGSV
jgi:hypothetical protein